ncbi:MAG: hypothetical protein JWN79_2786 [Gemmatimonadetes bacterium]|jgi:iron-sulfur cluster repair protein YtfE (RIC family)|nr:hypothetical protein [Gemmatimonadota bacterium]
MTTNRSGPSAHPIDPTWSVNQLIAHLPESMQLLNAYGVDTCCGGELPLQRAAREANVELELLLELLQSVAEEAR